MTRRRRVYMRKRVKRLLRLAKLYGTPFDLVLDACCKTKRSGARKYVQGRG